MRVLLDAHALLWFVWGHPHLSSVAENLMAGADNELVLSTGTVWEIAIKVSLGKLTLAHPFEVFMERAIVENSLTVLPITVKHAAALTALPFHHRDPFDRLLAAQAIVEGIPIVSADLTFDAYGLNRVW